MQSPVNDEYLGQIREFVDSEVKPVVSELERRDEYPADLVATIAELGAFGTLAPTAYGGRDENLRTYWRVVAELSRGWVTLGQLMNTQSIATHLLKHYGTPEQRDRWLPDMAAGRARAGIAMTEPHAGSDVQNIRTTARSSNGAYVLSGRKKYIGSGERGQLLVVLAKTDPEAEQAHRGMGLFLVERQEGLVVERHVDKLGYRGFDTVQLRFDDIRLPSESLLGGEAGRGFYQIMEASEVGRINVAARAVGLMEAALEEALGYALERETFGRPIAEHQAVQGLLANMVTMLEASKALIDVAAENKVGRERADRATSIAKLFASESAVTVAMDAMRVHGGVGYTTERAVERLYREAPQMVIAEGTSEIQRLIIARDLIGEARAS